MENFCIKTKANFSYIIDKSHNKAMLGDTPGLLKVPLNVNFLHVTLFSEINPSDTEFYRLLNFARGKITEIELYNINIGDKELDFISEYRPAVLVITNASLSLDPRRQFIINDTIQIKIRGVKDICFLSQILFPQLGIMAFGEGVDLSSFDCSAFQSVHTISILGADIPKEFTSLVTGVALSTKNISEVNIGRQFPFARDVALFGAQDLNKTAPLSMSELGSLFSNCQDTTSIMFSGFEFISDVGKRLDVCVKSDWIIFVGCKIRSLGNSYRLHSSEYSFKFCELNCCDFSFVVDAEADFFSSMIDAESFLSATKSFRGVEFRQMRN